MEAAGIPMQSEVDLTYFMRPPADFESGASAIRLALG